MCAARTHPPTPSTPSTLVRSYMSAGARIPMQSMEKAERAAYLAGGSVFPGLERPAHAAPPPAPGLTHTPHTRPSIAPVTPLDNAALPPAAQATGVNGRVPQHTRHAYMVAWHLGTSIVRHVLELLARHTWFDWFRSGLWHPGSLNQ